MYFLYTAAFFLLSAYVSIWTQKKIAQPSEGNFAPLPDAFHNLTSENGFLAKFFWLTNYIIYLYFFIILWYQIEACKFFNLLSLLFLLRSCMYSATVLPTPTKHFFKSHYQESVLSILIKYLTLQDRNFGHTNDLIFSGHVSTMILFSLHTTKYMVFSTLQLTFFWLLTLVSCLSVVASRSHYSICAMVAIPITHYVYLLVGNYF